MHLSGIEHNVVRKQGFEKGIAVTNLTTSCALRQTLARHALVQAASPPLPLLSTMSAPTSFGGAADIPSDSYARRLSTRTLVAVPFYGGAAAVVVAADGKVNVTRPVGSGNSHTLAPAALKFMQLATVVASAQLYFGMVLAK
jgi:hypothetical protein